MVTSNFHVLIVNLGHKGKNICLPFQLRGKSFVIITRSLSSGNRCSSMWVVTEIVYECVILSLVLRINLQCNCYTYDLWFKIKRGEWSTHWEPSVEDVRTQKSWPHSYCCDFKIPTKLLIHFTNVLRTVSFMSYLWTLLLRIILLH